MQRRNFLKGLLATIAGLPLAANLKPNEAEIEAVAQEIELPSEPLPENFRRYDEGMYMGTMLNYPLMQRPAPYYTTNEWRQLHDDE